nr:hypothetical protein [Tanacetum cinerariifolium]
MEKSQSNLTTDEHKELYKALINSYNVNKDLFLVYGKAVSLKRGRKDKDKDEDPHVGSDLRTKRQKIRKDVESSNGSKSKELKSTSSSKVTKVKVMKWYDYGYLEEIVVRREDHQLYKFKEASGGPLTGSRKLPEEAQYHQPETFRSNISNETPYTAYNNPQRIIYEDKYHKNRLMRTDELYKFSDGTLTSVRSVLHDIAINLRMDYLLKRIWSILDRKRPRIMIKAIDQLLLEKRLMRSLEKFVGGRDYGEDL